MKTFVTERANKNNFGYNQFKTFYAPNPIYTNNIERYPLKIMI